MRLASIVVYPVKGCRGVSLSRARLAPRGLEHDRRFMLVDDRGDFVTQRRHPALARVRTSLVGEALGLEVHGEAGARRVCVPLAPHVAAADRPRARVRVWQDEVEAALVSDEADALVSGLLGARVRLVVLPDDVVRPVDGRYARAFDQVSFADGFPLLLAAQASLDDVNARLADAGSAPVPMDRFRPNLVVEGGAAFEEDRATHVRVGDVTFRMPKRCARCQVVTVDQETGDVGREPLRTLAAYRREGASVYFGQNLVPELEGRDGPGAGSPELAVGDAVSYFRA